MGGANSQFTDSNGGFSFSDVPRGQFALTARKPGFFNSGDLGMWGPGTMESVPAGHDIVLTLSPEAITENTAEKTEKSAESTAKQS